MKIHHLFWDFDGTLYRSYPQMLSAMRRTPRELHLDDISESDEKLLIRASPR